MKIFLFTILLVSGSIAFCQKQNLTGTFPGPIEDPLFIYHPPSRGMLLIGGTPIIQDSIQSDVWKWDGKNWSRIEAGGPGARVFFQGGLQTKNGTIQLFAGAGLGRSNSLMRDLWSFDGSNWSEMATNEIGTHDHHKMVYADHIGAFVLYGGNRDHVFDTVTWLMRDGQFIPLHIPGPGIRYQSGMVYDKHREKVVLYGGGEHPDELWEFDGERWEKIKTGISPGIKLYHHMVYDETLKVVILHGGLVNHNPRDPINLVPPITWVWNGKAWRKIAEERIYPMAIGYHPVRKSVMAYGYNKGNANVPRNIGLWELKNYKWTLLTDYGEWNTVRYLEKHLAQSPNDLRALLVYAHSLRSLDRLPEAETAYRKLIGKELPENRNVLVGLIEVLMGQGKLSEAEEWVSKTKDSRLYYNLACAYALSSNPGKSFEHLNRAAGLGYNNRKYFENDTDLESLRSDARWKLLLEKLK